MDLDLPCVESFLVLAHEGHFGKAARRLNLSVAGLSKRLTRLEGQVGIRLVDRDSSGYLALTPAGAHFLSHCYALLRSAREARRSALEDREPPVVRLGIPGSPADHLSLTAWRTMVVAMAQVLPGCHLRACRVPYGRLEESLLTHRVDVLLSTGEFDHPELLAVPMMLAYRVLLVPAHHELAEAERLGPADIADLPLIREPTATPEWMAPWLLQDLRDLSETPVVDVRARSLADVQTAILTGVAVTIASATVTPLLNPGLRAVPLMGVPPTPLAAVRRRRDDRDEIIAALQTLKVLFAALAVNSLGTSCIAQPALVPVERL